MYAMYVDIQNTYIKFQEKHPNTHIEEFDLPTDDGNYFRFKFQKPNDVQMWTHITKTNKDVLITKNHSSVEELQNDMNTRTEDMEIYSVHLGEAPTKAFLNSLNNAQIGDIITYNTGFTVIVTQRHGIELELITAYQNEDNISIKNFNSKETQIIDISNPANMRDFYRMTKDLRTETCELRSTTQKSVRAELETEVLSLDMFKTKKFYVGDEWFVGQKFPNSIKWFDKDGNKIDEDTIVRFYAWAKTAPTKFSIRVPKNNILQLDRYSKYKRLETLQNLFAQGNIEKLESDIINLLDDNTSMTFTVSSLTKQSSNYIKTKFAFAKENGHLHIFEIKDEKIQQTSVDKFIKFYQEKYDNHYQALHEKVFTDIAQKTTKENTFSETKQKIVTQTEELLKNVPVKFEPVDEDGINELINAFVEGKQRDKDDGLCI
jgi:hypothetical protein